MARIVLLNPNTTAALADLMVEIAREVVAAGLSVEGLTAPFGPALITCKLELDEAARAVLSLAPVLAQRADAIIVGAFGDPGDIVFQSYALLPQRRSRRTSAMASRRAARQGPMLRRLGGSRSMLRPSAPPAAAGRPRAGAAAGRQGRRGARPRAGLQRACRSPPVLEGELCCGGTTYGPGTIVYMPDPHFEDEMTTKSGCTVVFLQYPGPTTGARPIYDGRMNLEKAKSPEEYDLNR